jgi:hypothetical protein
MEKRIAAIFFFGALFLSAASSLPSVFWPAAFGLGGATGNLVYEALRRIFPVTAFEAIGKCHSLIIYFFKKPPPSGKNPHPFIFIPMFFGALALFFSRNTWGEEIFKLRPSIAILVMIGIYAVLTMGIGAVFCMLVVIGKGEFINASEKYNDAAVWMQLGIFRLFYFFTWSLWKNLFFVLRFIANREETLYALSGFLCGILFYLFLYFDFLSFFGKMLTLIFLLAFGLVIRAAAMTVFPSKTIE